MSPSTRTVERVDPRGAAALAGVRTGDRINLREIGFRERWRLVESGTAAVGEHLRYVVHRGPVSRTIVVVTRPHAFTPDESWDWKYFAGTIASLLFAVLLAVRRPDLPAARWLALFLVTTTASEALEAIVPWPEADLALTVVGNAVNLASPIFFILFLACFDAPRSRLQRLLANFTYAISGISAMMYAISALLYSLWGVRSVGGWSIVAFHHAAGGVAMLAALACGAATAAGLSGTGRQRAVWATLSVGLLFAPAGVLYLFGFWLTDPVIAFGNVLINLGGVAMATGLTYGVLSRRIIDVGFILNRTIVFGTIAVTVVGILVFFDWLYTNYVTQTRWQIGIGIAAAFAVGWAARGALRTLIAYVDALFFPKRHAVMQRVDELRRGLETSDSPEHIDRAIVSGAAEALQLYSAALFVRTRDGGFLRQSAVGWTSGTAWHLFTDDEIVERLANRDGKATRIDDVQWLEVRIPSGAGRPILAIPLDASRWAYALYGAHADGRDIDPDEMRGLADLCAAAAMRRA